MNKTDRMLAIVLELQRKKQVTAEELATTFETSVRTIYRDMQALSEAGVPVVGYTGLGYSLLEGYFLPPVCFTAEEAVALLIGTDFARQHLDSSYGRSAVSSCSKIEGILPPQVRQEAADIRQTMRLISPAIRAIQNNGTSYIGALRGAILHRRKVELHYRSGSDKQSDKHPEGLIDSGPDGSLSGRHSVRTVAPYGLVFNRNAWVLVAWCELRREMRHFRLGRIAALTVLEERFELPPDFSLEKYKPADDRRLIIRLVVDTRLADRVIESNNFYIEETEKQVDGLHVTLRVRREEEVLPWVLGWGSGAVVLEPETFRDRIRQEAEKLLQRY